jgi:competence protein ComEA
VEKPVPSNTGTSLPDKDIDDRSDKISFSVPDIDRYRPGIALLAAVILAVCAVSNIARWADGRFFPGPAQPRVVCRAPGGAIEILPRGTTVGEALERREMENTGIADAALERTIPDGSQIRVMETRTGRRVVIEEMPAAERYALGLDFDINRAAAPDIALVPGVGEASAARIVAWRKTHGDFVSKEALAAVPGLGADKARTIARYVSFGPKLGDTRDGAEAGEDDDQGRPSDKLTKDDVPLDINTAAAADLVRIPGVGEVTAGRIIDCRNTYGPFKTVTDLERVKGIGKKKAQVIAGYVTF